MKDFLKKIILRKSTIIGLIVAISVLLGWANAKEVAEHVFLILESILAIWLIFASRY